MSGPETERFDVDVDQLAGVVVVRPSGALDAASAPVLADILADLAQRSASAVLDLGALRAVDSAGLRVILEAHAYSQRDGFGLTLLPAPPAVMRIFELAGVVGELPFAR